jgi:hypothetical protein
LNAYPNGLGCVDGSKMATEEYLIHTNHVR